MSDKYIFDVDGVIVVQMGDGAVLVCPGLMAEQEKSIGSISFSQDVPGSINRLRAVLPGTKDTDIEARVRLVFTDLESIDVLIWAAEQAKKFMLQGKAS